MTNEQGPDVGPEQDKNPEVVPTNELWEWVAQERATMDNSEKIIDANASDSESGAKLTDLRKSFLAGESAAVARFARRLDGKEKEPQPPLD